MKQIYHHYKEWEDYINGMYDAPEPSNEDRLIVEAMKLLSNQDRFFKVSLLVMEDWKISTDVNLSNRNSNRRSWIGQSACSYECNVPEILTRVAWSMISQDTRNEANETANKIIRIYEEKNRKLHSGMGEKGLF